MAAIDATAVGIALPRIGHQFHASITQVQWVVAGYTLSLAALLLLGGSLGDRWGRRRVFRLGAVWFTVASLACALTPGIDLLIVTRVLQGAGAALLVPASLAIIEGSFVDGDQGRAVGAWSGLGGVATAAGPLLGGYLITAASWRWIFLINLPLGLALLWISARHVPESMPATARRLDLPGTAFATASLAALCYGLMQGPAQGWSRMGVVAALAVATAAGAGLLVTERRSAAPLLPAALFRIRAFTVTNAVTFVLYGALGGALFLLPVVLQVSDRYSPLLAGSALLPVTALMLLLSPTSGRVAARIGPRLQMSVGPLTVGLGLFLLSRASTDPSYLTGVLPGALVFGLGLAATVAPLTATALGAAGAESAGLASAINNDVARVGGLIAVAILPPLAGLSGAGYLHPARMATDFRRAVELAALWCLLGGAVAAVGLRGRATGTPRAETAAGGHAFRCPLEAPPLVPPSSPEAAATR